SGMLIVGDRSLVSIGRTRDAVSPGNETRVAVGAASGTTMVGRATSIGAGIGAGTCNGAARAIQVDSFNASTGFDPSASTNGFGMTSGRATITTEASCKNPVRKMGE